MWLSRACRAAAQLICISPDWKWQEEAVILVSLKRTSIPIPKSGCFPRTGHVNSSSPLCWGQGLSVSVLHHISFLTSATKVCCCPGTISGDLAPCPSLAGSCLSPPLPPPGRLRWSPGSAAWSTSASWHHFCPQSCWFCLLLGGPSSNHPNSNAEYLKWWWDCSKCGILRYPPDSGAATLYLAQTQA